MKNEKVLIYVSVLKKRTNPLSNRNSKINGDMCAWERMERISSKSSPKVPWEPYKAATSSTSIIPLNPSSLLECYTREGLVKYKTDTNLDEFNAQRPGTQFDQADLSLLAEQNQQMAPEKLFLDARFYTDVAYLKLANQLRGKAAQVSPGYLATFFY